MMFKSQIQLTEKLTLEDIKNSVLILMDTRFPKNVSLYREFYCEGPYKGENFCYISEEDVIWLVKEICKNVINSGNRIFSPSGYWIKYLQIYRVSQRSFTILDRHNDPISNISSLGIDPKNMPSKKT